jgi:hypothetical protein
MLLGNIGQMDHGTSHRKRTEKDKGNDMGAVKKGRNIAGKGGMRKREAALYASEESWLQRYSMATAALETISNNRWGMTLPLARGWKIGILRKPMVPCWKKWAVPS